MDLFDSAIFDSAVFDTGAEAQVEAVLQRFVTLDSARKRRRRDEEEAERLERERQEQAREVAEQALREAIHTVEPAPVVLPDVPEVVALGMDAGPLREQVEQLAAEAIEQWLAQQAALQQAQDDEAAMALLSYLMAA